MKGRNIKRILLPAMTSIWGFFIGFLGIILILSGILIFVGQVYIWLKKGEWVEIPLRIVFAIIPEGSPLQLWLNDPQSWHGLHKLVIGVLDFIPLSLFLIVLGLWIRWMFIDKNRTSKDT
jgi:hypothetical protein